MKEIAQTKVRYGCQRIQVLLKREGWKDNHKRVHRSRINPGGIRKNIFPIAVKNDIKKGPDFLL